MQKGGNNFSQQSGGFNTEKSEITENSKCDVQSFRETAAL